MNFFDADCQEVVPDEALFGICDDQYGLKAYINTDDQTKWVAIVENNRNKNLIFTAIDKCVIKDEEEPDRGRCDGMLTSDEHLFFVELKDEAKGWIPAAIKQLESTVKFFIEHHDISVYKHKKAFACNKKRRHFHEIDNELNLRFFRKYSVRIDVQATIIVV